jgi:hypothetical protein
MAAGFRLVPAERGEEVYERVHEREPRYAVRVYSSIQRGEGETRERGKDAIRIVAVATETTQPGVWSCLFSAPRVHRSGTVEGVLDRVIERAREAYAAVDRHRLSTVSAERVDGAAQWLNRELRRRA